MKRFLMQLRRTWAIPQLVCVTHDKRAGSASIIRGPPMSHLNRLLFILTLFASNLVGAETAKLDALHDQKIAVNYYRHYLAEIADDLQRRYDVPVHVPAVNRTFVFTLKDDAIALKDLLAKVAAESNWRLESRDGQLFLWEQAGD